MKTQSMQSDPSEQGSPETLALPALSMVEQAATMAEQPATVAEQAATMAEQPATVAEQPATIASELNVDAAFWGADARSLPKMIGAYQVIKELGRGGMGVVLLAYHPQEQRKVAIKLISARHAQGSALWRFRREFRAMQQLNHPYVIRVFDGAFDGEEPYFVMEFVEGVNLRQHAALRWGTAGGAAKNLHALLELTGQIVEALGYIHSKRLVHRDFKPDNVMVDVSGVAKLMDFGLAKQMDPQSVAQTAAGMILGTVAYMAPEQILGHVDLDGRTDFYALGVTLYELTTGQLPFRGEVATLLHQHLKGQPRPPRELAPWMEPELESLILKLMAREIQARPSSAQEILASLGSLMYRSQAVARPVLAEVTDLLVPAFVGHENLAEWLEARLGEAEGGEAGIRVVLIPAEAGLGKSRFLDAVADWAKEQLLLLARSSCRPEHRAPFSAAEPLFDAAQRQVGWLSDEDRELMRPLVALIPSLAELLGGGDEVSAENALPAGVAFLEAALQYQPLIFLIDDLHWADELSLDFLRRLATHHLPLRLLVLAAYRPEALDEAHPVHQFVEGGQGQEPLPCLRHELPLLRREDLERLVGSALGGQPSAVEPELLSAVLERAKGSPLSVLRALRELVLLRRVHNQDQHFVLAGSEAQLVPRPDQATRLLALSSGPVPEAHGLEKTVLEAVAVFGRGVPMEILVGLVQAEEALLLDAINRLLQKRLLRETRGSKEVFEFTQEAIREALYQALPIERRRELHGKVAQALEARGESIDVLAYHYRAAALHESALRLLLKCVDQALHLCAYRDAIRLADEALAVLQDPSAEALRNPFESRFLNRQCQAWYFLAELNKALKAAQGALEAARRGTDLHSILTAENSIGMVCKELMRLDEARQHFESALALAQQLEHKQLQAYVSNNLALLQLLEGKGREELEKAVQLAEEMGDSPMKVVAMFNLALLEMHEGTMVQALQRLDEARSLALQCQLKAEAMNCEIFSGVAFKIQGDWSEAERTWRRALEKERDSSELSLIHRGLLELAELELHRGRLAKAEQWLHELTPAAEGDGSEEQPLQEPGQELRRLRLQVRRQIALCEWSKALERLQALPEAGEKSAVQGLNLFLKAQLYASIGRLREAFPLFDQVEQNCEALRFGSLVWVVRFTRMLFQLDTARAPQSLLEPLAGLLKEAEGRDLWMWAHILRLRWLAAKGDPDSTAWGEAWAFFEKQGADADFARGLLGRAETLLNRRREADALRLLAERDSRLSGSELPWVQLVHASLLAALDKGPQGAEAAARAMELLRRQSEALPEKEREPFLAHPAVQRIRARLGRRR